MKLRVKPSLEVQVIVNRRISEKKIKTFINSKANLLYKHLEKFRKAKLEEKENKLITGEFINYLGNKYTLIVQESSKNEMKYDKGKFYIFVDDI